MVVCLCRQVTEGQIRSAIDDGACCMRDLNKKLGVATQCGKCGIYTRQLLRQHGLKPRAHPAS